MHDSSFVSITNQGAVCKKTLAFLRLLGKNMTLECALAFNFSGAGNLEPFLGTGMRFCLWHN